MRISARSWASRLVKEKEQRIAHEGPAHRHALTLAAGELAGLAVKQGFDL
jgi:hypothetical protein